MRDILSASCIVATIPEHPQLNRKHLGVGVLKRDWAPGCAKSKWLSVEELGSELPLLERILILAAHVMRRKDGLQIKRHQVALSALLIDSCVVLLCRPSSRVARIWFPWGDPTS